MYEILSSNIRKSKYAKVFEQLVLSIEKSEYMGREILENYKGQYSGLINRMLRKRRIEKNDAEIFYFLEMEINNALEQFPNHNNQIVFRKETPQQGAAFANKWFLNNLNTTICFPSFISCSKVNTWMGEDSLIFEITTAKKSNAYDVSIENKSSSEKEVLFKSKTHFKILDLIESEGKVILIETAEQYSKTIYFGEEYHEFPRQIKNSSLLESGLI